MKLGFTEKCILCLFIIAVLLGFIALLIQNEILNKRIITAIYEQAQNKVEVEVQYAP